MYSNFFETRKDMQQGLEILKQVLVDFQNKENISIYACDCIDWVRNRTQIDPSVSLKMWIGEQLGGKFSYGTWIAHYHPEILVKEKLHDSREVDESEKIVKSRMLWIKHMISKLEEYLEENKE